MNLLIGKWTVLIDDDIAEDILAMGRWRVLNNRHRLPYATLAIGGTMVTMHRVIMGVTDPNEIVDHINQNPLDNRKENLRVVTKAQNTWNRKKQAVNTSGYRGVSPHRDKRGKLWWRAGLSHKNQKLHIGSWKTKEEAARAYDRAVKHYRGEFGVLNFPYEITPELENKFRKVEI